MGEFFLGIQEAFQQFIDAGGLVAVAPAITAVGAIIIAVVKCINTVKEEAMNACDCIRHGVDEIRDDIDVKELKTLTREIVQENYNLKKTVTELTNSINHIRNGGANEQNNKEL